MKNRLAVLLLIPACLFTFICNDDREPEETTPVTEVTEETVVATTERPVDTTVNTTEPTIPETTESPTELPATEPHTTEREEPELISLGIFKLTAYCACQKCCGSYSFNRPVDENGNVIVYGSIGVRLEAGVSIAVDPRVIPYGTQVVINGHTYTAHDTGGSIVGSRIDVYFDDHQDALNFGTQYAEIFIYG